MGKYIGVKKILEKDNIGFYEVEAKEGDIYQFYIGVDKYNRLINVYLTNNVSDPFLIIDPAVEGEIDGKGKIDPLILIHVVAKAIKVFDLDYYPNYLSYQV